PAGPAARCWSGRARWWTSAAARCSRPGSIPGTSPPTSSIDRSSDEAVPVRLITLSVDVHHLFAPATVHTVVLRVSERSRHRARPGPARVRRWPADSVRPDGTALCSLGLVVLFLPAAGGCLLPFALLARRGLGVPLWLCYGLWL